MDLKIGESKMKIEVSKKESFIRQILKREWEFFQNVHHMEGRAECQDNPQEFEIMRRSQWETLPDEILESYLEDLILAKHRGENIVQDKYARMMKYSAPKEYEVIKNYLPEIPQEKKRINQKNSKNLFTLGRGNNRKISKTYFKRSSFKLKIRYSKLHFN